MNKRRNKHLKTEKKLERDKTNKRTKMKEFLKWRIKSCGGDNSNKNPRENLWCRFCDFVLPQDASMVVNCAVSDAPFALWESSVRFCTAGEALTLLFYTGRKKNKNETKAKNKTRFQFKVLADVSANFDKWHCQSKVILRVDGLFVSLRELIRVAKRPGDEGPDWTPRTGVLLFSPRLREQNQRRARGTRPYRHITPIPDWIESKHPKS